MVNKVFFSEDEKVFLEKLKSELKDYFSGKVAIKLHMGELGNKYFLKPEFVKKIVAILKDVGAEPFLFDSLVVYDSPRNSVKGYLEVVKKHGFDNLGCPVLISDDFIEQEIVVDGKKIVFQVCKTLAEADGVLVLSHVKGHFCSGFGASIKNIGMGALSKKSKDMIHKGGEPVYVSGCTSCCICAKNCPTNNIRYGKQKNIFKKILGNLEERPFFDKNWCCGCSNCVVVCSQKAIKAKTAIFNDLLSAGALAALKNFKNVFFVNVVKDISKLCDCMGNAGPLVSQDIGYLISKDLTSIDKAAHDLIVKKSGKDVFKEIHHVSPLSHIESFAKIANASLSYKLIKI